MKVQLYKTVRNLILNHFITNFKNGPENDKNQLYFFISPEITTFYTLQIQYINYKGNINKITIINSNVNSSACLKTIQWVHSDALFKRDGKSTIKLLVFTPSVSYFL